MFIFIIFTVAIVAAVSAYIASYNTRKEYKEYQDYATAHGPARVSREGFVPTCPCVYSDAPCIWNK